MWDAQYLLPTPMKSMSSFSNYRTNIFFSVSGGAECTNAHSMFNPLIDYLPEFFLYAKIKVSCQIFVKKGNTFEVPFVNYRFSFILTIYHRLAVAYDKFLRTTSSWTTIEVSIQKNA